MAKYIKDGMVAILVSPGFGGSWSSTMGDDMFNYDKLPGKAEFFASDETLVHMVEDGKSKDEIDDYLTSQGYPDTYLGMGLAVLVVRWIPVGTKYYIHEYDGHEDLITMDPRIHTA